MGKCLVTPICKPFSWPWRGPGSHNPILRGQQLTMVINHLQVLGWSSKKGRSPNIPPKNGESPRKSSSFRLERAGKGNNCVNFKGGWITHFGGYERMQRYGQFWRIFHLADLSAIDWAGNIYWPLLLGSDDRKGVEKFWGRPFFQQFFWRLLAVDEDFFLEKAWSHE